MRRCLFILSVCFLLSGCPADINSFEIRNAAAQQQLTGKSVEEMKAELKTDITTDTAEARSGKLENRFDKDKMQKELDYQVKAMQDFQTITLPVLDKQMNKQAEDARKAAKDAAQKGDNQTANKLNEEAKKWETGGDYRQAIDAVSRAVSLALGGTPTEGVVAAAASPYINEQIKHATEGNPTANAIAHAVWGAVESKLQGGKAEAGAIAATAGELGAGYIAEKLYGTSDPNKLTEAQKQTVTELSKTAAGLASGLTSAVSGGNSTNIAQATQTGQGIAESAVENNLLLTSHSEKYLSENDKTLYRKLKENGVEDSEKYQKKFAEAKTESEKEIITQQYKAAVARAGERLVELYKNGVLTDEDYLNLFSYFADGMLKGIQDAQKNGVKANNLSVFEQDPYTRSGVNWTSAGLMNDENVGKLYSIYLERQVQKGKLSPSAKENKLEEFNLFKNAVSDVNFNLRETAGELRNNLASAIENNDIGLVISSVAQTALNKATHIPQKGVNNHKENVSNSSGNPILGYKYEPTYSNTDYIIEGSKPSVKGKLVKSQNYENPGHHDPRGGNSNQYNSTKSVLPTNHVELWNKSILGSDGNRWAKESIDGKTIYHRFQNDGNGNFHWNGSTNGKTKSGMDRSDIGKIPKEILKEGK